MCPVRIELTILMLAALIPGVGAANTRGASPEPVEAALAEAGMFDVLEAHLLGLESQAAGEDQRSEILHRLADHYAARIRALPANSDERAGVVERAWRLAERIGVNQAIDLRLALMLEAYLPTERAVELHELDLLDETDRETHIGTLLDLHTGFLRMAEAATRQAEIEDRRSRGSEDERMLEQRQRAFRDRSMTHYYAAWSGLMLATLQERSPDSEVLRSFGWLLGSPGEAPKFDDVSAPQLELDHVARAALGVGRARARLREWSVAEQWFLLLIDSDRVSPGVREQALVRYLRLKADQGDWDSVVELIARVRGAGSTGQHGLPTPDARYLAMRALSAQDGGPARTRGRQMAGVVAKMAIDDLIEAGEIGHVLDLRVRYGGLDDLIEGFVGAYVTGLDRLEQAVSMNTPAMFGDAANRLARAAEQPDAARFQVQRVDALLKAAFAHIRAGQPRQAADIARPLAADSADEQAREEALWLLIVALDEGGDDRSTPELHESVRRYIGAHPRTERAGRLLVRHAGADFLEPAAVTEGLRSFGADDPLVLRARRVLARLLYQQWTAGRRTDAQSRSELVELIVWVWANEPPSADHAEGQDRMNLARIGLDLALGASPVLLDLAVEAADRARTLMREDPTLRRYENEVILREVEIAVAQGRLNDGADRADQLHRAASPLTVAADRMLLHGVFSRLDEKPDDEQAVAVGARIGLRLSGELIPPAPGRLSEDASRVIDRVARLIASQADRLEDDSARATALRLGRVVLERGRPTGQGLRELAGLAGLAGDAQTQLAAWNALLNASKSDEPVWWEARYETLRVLSISDREAARRAYQQHRVLHPLPGVLPWTKLIDELFAPVDPPPPDEETAP